jgi:hypothetical protein
LKGGRTKGDDGEDEVNTPDDARVIDASLFGEVMNDDRVHEHEGHRQICLWVTPSARFLTVEPTMISPVLGDGTSMN